MDDNTYFELAPEAVSEYRGSLERLEKSANPYERLEILAGMFESFENSCSREGRSPEWARELILVYRNLGRILIGDFEKIDNLMGEEEEQMLSELGEEVQRYRKRIQVLEREVRGYEERLGSLETI